MKRNKFMEFLNSKGQYAAIFAFIVVAGICAGTAAYNRGLKDTNDAGEQSVQGTSEPVITNKNAEPAADVPKTPESVPQKSVESVPQAKPETAEPAENSSAWLDEDEGDFEIAFAWPVEGDILMGYSPDKLVYDATLDQYRTNNSVCIAADEGSPVAAAAEGTVAEVSEDEILGSYVVVEHENGWKTTYSQLADIEVAAGDAVSQGDTLGVVAKPSIYSSDMGAHVEFTVTLDDMTVDPEIAIG